MEYLQLFDEDKNVLKETVTRDNKKSIKKGNYFMIILLFLENDKHEFLIQKTYKERDSVYATTGGHVSYGDDNITTVIKEAKEELGITLSKEDIVFIDSEKHDVAYCDVFYAHKNIPIEDFKIQEDEVDAVYWMSQDEINSLIKEGKFRKGNINQYQKVLKYIKGNK